jgi:hypothetical protein
MNLHLGYPGVTKGLKLIGITPISKLKRGHMHPLIAKPRIMLTDFPPTTFYEPKLLRPGYPTKSNQPSLNQSCERTIPLMIVSTAIMTALHPAEVTQLYPWVSDFIIR